MEQLRAQYRETLMQGSCADYRGSGDARLKAERKRLQGILRRAEENGFADDLRQAEREWAHFQTVAEWACDEGAGLESFGREIDRLEKAIGTLVDGRRR